MEQLMLWTAESNSTELDRLAKEFVAFGNARGWDEDRRLQVLAELAYPEPWNEMLR